MRRIIYTILVITISTAISQQTGDRSAFGFQEMFQIKKARSPRLSPDGRYVVFQIYEADSSQDHWISHLWRTETSTGETIQLTRSTGSETTARWSPDGRFIVFRSKRESEHYNLYRIRNSGGEAVRLFFHPAEITDFQFNSSGRKIYFLAKDSLTPQEKEDREQGNDVYFYDHKKRGIRLWEYDLDTGYKSQLTGDDYSVREFELAPDGEQIAFVAAPSARRDDYLKREIYLLNLKDRGVRKISDNHTGERRISWSPDGRYLSFTSDANSTLETYYQDSIFLIDLQTGMVIDLLPGFPDQVFDYFWTKDGRYIYFITNTGVNTQFFRLNRRAGGVEQLTTPDQVIRSVHYRPEANWMVYLQSTPDRPYDVFVARPNRLPGRKITSLNSWLDSFNKAEYRTIHWTSVDGYEAEGILILPGKNLPKPLPLVLQLHGGPESSYRNSFGSSWSNYPQIWAAQGYAVFQPNYRGSTGYGDDVMRTIIGHYFEKDIDDIISGVDYLVNEGIADPEKMAVMGWSAGGHLTNWIITHFQRFKAACSGAGGANWYSFYAQTDMQYIREIWHLGPPYSRQNYYLEKSPVTYVQNAKTPTLILCGEEDRRVPFSQSLEMYGGLKRYGVKVKFAAFPGEGHGLRQIKHQLYKMRLEFQWVEKHLFNREWQLEDLK